AAARHASTLPKKRGLAAYGPPSSGQNASQCPHSLHRSAKFPNCRGLVTTIGSSTRDHQRPCSCHTVSRRIVPAGSTNAKFASLGQIGTHLSHAMQSSRRRARPILRGGRLFAAHA